MTNPGILVATDRATDGEMVKDMLAQDFESIHLSTIADRAAMDFEMYSPMTMSCSGQ